MSQECQIITPICRRFQKHLARIYGHFHHFFAYATRDATAMFYGYLRGLFQSKRTNMLRISECLINFCLMGYSVPGFTQMKVLPSARFITTAMRCCCWFSIFARIVCQLSWIPWFCKIFGTGATLALTLKQVLLGWFKMIRATCFAYPGFHKLHPGYLLYPTGLRSVDSRRTAFYNVSFRFDTKSF